MASLRRKPDGRYYIDYIHHEHGRKRVSVVLAGQPVRDRGVAEAFFAEWLRTHELAPAPTADRAQKSPRISRVLDYYRDVYLVATNAAQATHDAAATHCAAFLEWCRGQRIGNCQQLSKDVMTRYTADLLKTRSPRTARNYVTCIRTAINVAVDAEILESSPIRGKWQLPKVDDVERHPLNQAELSELMGLFQDKPVVLWMALTGNRPSDAISLRFRDVDLESRTVERRSVKVRRLRKYEICREAAALVAREAERPHQPEDPVFLSSLGRPWTNDGLLKSFKCRLVTAEYKRDVTPVLLRHSFGTIMANDIGVPLPELQILMGHSDIKTTMKYVRSTGARRWLDVWDGRISKDK
jgi:integrase